MWGKVSLYKYRELEKINASAKDDIDKVLFSTCVFYGITEMQLDNTKPLKAARMIERMGKLLQAELNPRARKRIGKYWIDYSIENMRFGQYIEMAYWLQKPVGECAHLVLASASHCPFMKNNAENHRQKAEYFLHQPIEKTLGSALLLIKNFETFNKSYKGLFGLKQTQDESDFEVRKIESDPFNKQYGWIFSATQVKDHEGITLEQAFNLPVTQALNDLSYLKALGRYQKEQLKKK